MEPNADTREKLQALCECAIPDGAVVIVGFLNKNKKPENFARGIGDNVTSREMGTILAATLTGLIGFIESTDKQISAAGEKEPDEFKKFVFTTAKKLTPESSSEIQILKKLEEGE